MHSVIKTSLVVRARFSNWINKLMNKLCTNKLNIAIVSSYLAKLFFDTI